MRKKIAKRKKELNLQTKNLLGFLIANIAGLLSTIIFSFLCSMILVKSQILAESLSGYLIGCVILGSLINGFIASKRCVYKGVISGLISSLSFALIITIMMLSFTKGQLASNAFIIHLVIIICSILGGIAGANTKLRR